MSRLLIDVTYSNRSVEVEIPEKWKDVVDHAVKGNTLYYRLYGDPENKYREVEFEKDIDEHDPNDYNVEDLGMEDDE